VAGGKTKELGARTELINNDSSVGFRKIRKKGQKLENLQRRQRKVVGLDSPNQRASPPGKKEVEQGRERAKIIRDPVPSISGRPVGERSKKKGSSHEMYYKRFVCAGPGPESRK